MVRMVFPIIWESEAGVNKSGLMSPIRDTINRLLVP